MGTALKYNCYAIGSVSYLHTDCKRLVVCNCTHKKDTAQMKGMLVCLRIAILPGTVTVVQRQTFS